ncbi:GatB/YqeY domain-containing protein [Nostoc sp. CHAB 5834]|nr:GatB/YqeY domain-containing protein [Nostoc sp. CHAB 5834]
MSILDKIKEASLEARKAREVEKATVLVTLFAEASRVGPDKGTGASTDEDVIKTARRFIKGLEDTIALVNNEVARERAVRERDLILSFLPKMVTGDALSALVLEILAGVEDRSPKVTGTVMKALRDRTGGAFEGAEASALIKQALAA